ncbi:MAG: phytase [Caulobacterales bacterium]
MKRTKAAALVVLTITSIATAAMAAKLSNTVPALRETATNGTANESAFGVVVWAAADKANSRIIGAQPQGEIDLYDLNGAIVQRIGLKAPRALDVRDQFYWLDGEGAILAATDSSDASIALFKLDPKTGMASNKPRGRIRTSLRQISSVCLGKLGADHMVVAIGKNAKGAGEVHAWSLAIDPWGDATGLKLGAFSLGAELSDCAVDDKTGALYVAESNRGIWRLDIADSTGTDRKLIDSLSPEGKLTYPINALTVWSGGGQSYVLASAGPDGKLTVYNGQNNRVMAQMNVGKAQKGKADAVSGGWGLGASGGDFGAEAPMGLVAIQDSQNTSPKRAANFKMVSFADIEKRIPFE